MTKRRTRITKADYEALAALRYALRHFLHFSENAARASGLTPQQHQALLAIKGFPGRDQITVGELAERLQLKHHSAVGLANRLVTGKLVARKKRSMDRRQVYLVLTRRGERLLEGLSEIHKTELSRTGADLKRIIGLIRK